MSNWIRKLAALAVTVTSALALAPAWAQPYPSKPITWIVPFTPGGITDTTSRAVAKRMGELLGQNIIVDNRPGVGGSLATEQVARMAADGYTLLYATSGTMAANLALYKNLKYDPLKDFTPVHGMFLSPLLLVTEASKPYKSVADLIAAAKKDPGAINFGSAGPGTATHLTGELFQTRSGTKLVHVPYKGTSPALQDLLGGRLDIMFDYTTILLPHIKAGKLRPLAVMSNQRLAALPDVPTIAEAGLSGAESSAWSSIVLPAGAPPEVVKKLAEAMNTALTDKAVVGPFIDNGSMPMVDLDRDKLKAFIASEMRKWAEVVKTSGASLN